MNIEAMKIVRDNLKMGHVLSFAEMMIIQQAIDAAMLQGKADGNSPVIPDGWVMVPVEPTAEMYDAGDRQLATKQVWDAMIAAAPQQENE
ncbi:hypothetical protein [Enterobacter sp. 638]|uniref:Phage protein n=1 Tax=Enterobacter sp. (strain 638) TaxID=399742 RepID=A0A9J9GEX2_ENT38|nr:hypothetical protein [Enterobacter sp. 638]ABP59704.1 hypothetical protein Ent638_1021 [Enterobacter sp. 638]